MNPLFHGGSNGREFFRIQGSICGGRTGPHHSGSRSSAFKSTRNSELVAVVSGDPRKQRALARMYRAAQAFSYDKYDQVLSLVDAVYLGLPNHLHKDIRIRAAEAGVHVLCEKPMAVTEEECEAMMHHGPKRITLSSWWLTGCISKKGTPKTMSLR